MDKEQRGRVIAVKRSLCYGGKPFYEESIREKPLKEVTFRGEQIMIPEDYVVMTYFGQEIIVHFSHFYGYMSNEIQRKNLGKYRVRQYYEKDEWLRM